MRPLHRILLLLLATLAAGALALAEPTTKPKSSLDYWLQNAATDSAPASAASEPTSAGGPVAREDALPGVVELSDGTILPGMLATTRGKCWEVYVDSERLWRRVPFEACLSISAVVEEEADELEWRWKEMGTPEKVYTGRSYPTRRLAWRLHLADDTIITGAIKGQPLYIDRDGKRRTYVLHERSKGEAGQKLADLIYVKRIVISRQALEAASAISNLKS